MKFLLKIKGIAVDTKDNEGDIYITEESGATVEIALTGAACRKIFTTFVLLFTLVDAPEKTKLFLIEEPEAQLYPKLHQMFMTAILLITKQHRIQVIVTTNSHLTLDLFPRQVIVMLSLLILFSQYLSSMMISRKENQKVPTCQTVVGLEMLYI